MADSAPPKADTPDWSRLPAPQDDGGARHLQGMEVPSILLTATDGMTIDLSEIKGRVVVYAYPKTSAPGTSDRADWDAIPGARGCTPQACAFRDHYEELKQAGVQQVFGLSTQDSAYQREAVQRLQLPFSLLSDVKLRLSNAMNFPRFKSAGATLLKRFTLVVTDGKIEKVFYPVFPPDQNASAVISWVTQNR